MVTRRIRATRLVSGCSLAVLASAALLAPAHAQDARRATAPSNADTVEEVVVTGFRASLASALNIKRQTSGVVDVIRAEDIAKFPDANLAESAAAHPRRLADARRRRRRQADHRARPERRLHPGADQRHRGRHRHRRLGHQRQHQPGPRLRLQRLRLGTVQLRRGAQDLVGQMSRKARWGRRSTCAAAGRSTIAARPSPWAPRRSTTAWRETPSPASPASIRTPGATSGPWSRWPIQSAPRSKKATRRSSCCRPAPTAASARPGLHAAEPGHHAGKGHRRGQLRVRPAPHLGAGGL